MKMIKTIFAAAVLVIGGSTFAQNATLDQLLQETRRAANQQKAENERREAEFRRQRDQQRQLLANARAQLQAAERLSDQLKAEFDENEKALVELETTLTERSGNLGEMFGVVRQVANDLKGTLEGSMVSAQYPGRTKFLSDLAQRKELPTIAELQELWVALQTELTEQGKITTFQAPVLLPDGTMDQNRAITRVGVFDALSDGKFLLWNPPSTDHKDGVLQELERQPADRFQSLIEPYESASGGAVQPLPLDFTSGVVLSLVVETKTWPERLGIGDGELENMGDAGIVGYVIMGIGILGLIVALWRGIVLLLKGMAIKAQLKKSQADTKNALGRVMAVYENNPDADVETLELKLDEAILRETGPLEAGLSFIKMLYVIAPLLGLLGTVVGMIATFQAITLFGTGDAKTMAGGISTALVTTVLGLVVAIPLTFLHSLLQARSRALIQILEEQSAGIVARMAEKQDGMAV